MNRASLVTSLVVVGAALAVGGFLAGRSSTPALHASAASSPASAASSARKVLYWHDPMTPGPRFDKPGKSPFMDMPLVPVYADEAGDSGVKISPLVQQNLGIRTARVTRADTSSSFEAVGTVQFDERLSESVQTRVAGYIERLWVRAPMEQVRKGQPLVTIFAPDWLAPQNELLALKRSGASEDLVAAARERMRALSVPDSLIRQAEETGTAQDRFTLSAPVTGVVAELGVREGVAVSPGTTLFRLAGLEKVWAIAEIPEVQAIRLVRGQKVKAVLQADASQSFDGELAELLPQVNASTRTLQARFEVENRGGKLTPGMLLRLQVAGPVATRLVVPSESVIRTGARTVAIVHRSDGSFEPHDVQLGADLGDRVEVVKGLAEGDQVVTSGQFLIDSEANLRSVTAKMVAPAASASSTPQMAPILHHGQGKVESIDAQSMTISHGPIASLKSPAMTMDFAKPSPQAFPDVKVGDTVHFEFKETDAGFELVSVERMGGSR
jgi:Cu(I)/Ag(I) efflux system membrane fusion protein